MERRTLIRLLVGFGIGIPVLIEGATFLGLLEARLLGGDEDEGTATPSPTPGRRVGVGDELLPETPQTETLTTATLRAAGGRWPLTLSVSVENGTDHASELRLGAVTLDGGRTVDGSATTGRLAPGEAGVATGRWELPSGSTPQAVAATAIQYADGEAASTTERTIRLERIPVEGG